jgi:hypothetical protein
MGYLLHMSDEIHGWLADLCASDPASAASAAVGQALTAKTRARLRTTGPARE